MRELLGRTGVHGENVSLEVNVANAGAALDDVAGFGAAIKPLGLTLTLSGFEAGAAGERLLDALPVDFIKLSPRYVRIDDDAMRKELRELVALAHERNMQVIAPRVEDARGAAALWSAGVDFIQGNFVQRAGTRSRVRFPCLGDVDRAMDMPRADQADARAQRGALVRRRRRGRRSRPRARAAPFYAQPPFHARGFRSVCIAIAAR